MVKSGCSFKYYSVESEAQGKRLDLYLEAKNPALSRSYIKNLICAGYVEVNNLKAPKAGYLVKPGDQVTLKLPPPVNLEVQPEDIPLEIFYEDEDLIVVNKPQGMVVHPGAGNKRGTLVNALLFHCRDLSGINGVLRPGIVHRLDKDTSGLLVAAKNDAAHLGLAAQIKARTVKRVYLALVQGDLQPETGVIDAPLGRHPVQRKKRAVVPNGKAATTRYSVRERFGDFTFIEAQLETGRTHQVRVHLAFRGHPVVGDPLYGKRPNPFGLKKQALHAWYLGFRHPRLGTCLEFQAPLPVYFQEILTFLRHSRQPGNFNLN